MTQASKPETLDKAVDKLIIRLGVAIKADDVSSTLHGTRDAISMAEDAKQEFKAAILAAITSAKPEFSVRPEADSDERDKVYIAITVADDYEQNIKEAFGL